MRGLGCWDNNVKRDACYVIVLEVDDTPFDVHNTQYESSRIMKHASR
jgi:hypothetical protein